MFQGGAASVAHVLADRVGQNKILLSSPVASISQVLKKNRTIIMADCIDSKYMLVCKIMCKN